MDRRTILAFALIFVVYVAWMKFYESRYATRPPAAAPDSSLVESAPDVMDRPAAADREPDATPVRTDEVAASAADLPAPGTDPLAFRERPPAEDVEVATPLFDLTIASRGGRIVSWRAGEFEDVEGRPVELVDAREVPLEGPGDAVVFATRELDLTDAPYRVQGSLERRLAAEDGPHSIVLEAVTEGGLVVRKIFTLHPGRYDFEEDLELVVPAGVSAIVGEPDRIRFGWRGGIASTEADRKLEAPSFRSFAMVGEELIFKKRQNVAAVEKVTESRQGTVRFGGLQNKYFLVAGVVPQDPTRPVEGRVMLGGDPERKQLTWAVELPGARTPRADELRLTARLSMVIGPSDFDLLKSYGVGLEKTVDLGWKAVRPLSELVLAAMTWMHGFIPNYGVIIIILSVLTKLAFYPLTRSSTRSMKKMQELQPKLKALQEKYKDNREKLSQKTMELYKEEKVNPMAGCLPLLVQMPVFIALYQALRNTIALRQAPFALWMNDLASPDALFQLPISLPFLGSSFNLLPVLMAVSMYFQTKMTPSAASGGQMAVMNSIMPFMMLFIFYNMPSGLVLYWLVNTVMQIYQTWRINSTAPATGGA